MAVSKNDKDIVKLVKARLAERVGRDRFEVWFGAATQLDLQGDTLTVRVANRFYQDWLRTNFRKDLELCCHQAAGITPAIEFRIDDTLHAANLKVADVPAVDETFVGTEPVPASSTNGQRTTLRLAKPRALPGHSPINQSIQPSDEVGSGDNTAASANAPVANGAVLRRPYARLDQFVVGDTSKVAHHAATMACQQPGSMSPLFIYGSHGVGKTHLLEGIWSGCKRTSRGGGALYLTAEQFTVLFLEALKGTGLPSFRRKYRGVETLLIDDLQFFLGKRSTISELLHTLDSLLRAGKQVVLAADRAPGALKDLGAELLARISSGVVCKIDRPDYETRVTLARVLAERLQISLPTEVLHFLGDHFAGDAREMNGAIKRLHATSQAWGKPITQRMADETLADLVSHAAKVVRLDDIDRAVCEVFGVESDHLKSQQKSRGVSHPRMLAMWLARKHTRAALSEIGQYFGQRTHSTVISAQKKIDAWRSKGHQLDLAQRNWKLDDAIRRVEEKIRAG
jgi:chromosomal replication initiator protein